MTTRYHFWYSAKQAADVNETFAMIDGKVVRYTECSVRDDLQGENVWDDLEYVGEGVIYSADGVIQNKPKVKTSWAWGWRSILVHFLPSISLLDLTTKRDQETVPIKMKLNYNVMALLNFGFLGFYISIKWEHEDSAHVARDRLERPESTNGRTVFGLDR